MPNPKLNPNQKTEPQVASQSEVKFRKTTTTTKTRFHVGENGELTVDVTRVSRTQEWFIDELDLID